MNKYKAKRLDNNEWVEGFYAIKGEGTDLEQHIICLSELDNCSLIDRFYLVDIEVDPKTVSQATGLKDKNGKMIFEGDCILCGTPQIKRVVSFESGRFGTKYDDSFYTLNGWIKGGRSVEIIGNIHDK